MSDKPILFSAPMVRALLKGRKTQTRRVLKPQPYPIEGRPGYWNASGAVGGRICICDRDLLNLHRKAEPGDRLWVREAHYLTDDGDEEYAVYAADGNDAVGEHLEQIASLERRFPSGPWARHKKLRPSIHMPRWASRITLTVTDVRVERLQDISEADAWAEGCVRGDPDDNGGHFPTEEPDPSGIGWRGWDNARDWYADLWESLHGAGSWDANPWVSAYGFTVEVGNIDQIGRAA